MSNIPEGEILVEKKVCKCGTEFSITDKDMEFYDKISPVFAGVKYSIPSPTLCPDCRLKRRLSFRNERNIYKRECNATGKEIISMYSPDKNYKVYSPKEWWSDKWDAMDYSRDFDFSKTFFEQFDELFHSVPQIALLNTENENCDYNNYIKGCKNSYLSSVLYYGCEDVYYSTRVWSSKDIFDCFNINECENCYSSILLEKCFNCNYLSNSYECSSCHFGRNLRGCKDCFMCTNLVNKQYYIKNVSYTKEEYENKISEIKKSSTQELLEEYSEFNKTQIVPYVNFFNCENCVGDNLKNSKNAYGCFDTYGIEDSKYLTAEEAKNSYDGIGGRISYGYEFCRGGFGQKIFFSFDSIESNNVFYCGSIYYSNNLFGCIGLRNKEYCVLNKQYTKEEYETLVPKIIEHMKKTGEWGEFFPASLSPFGYNETVANEYFPISKEEILKKGYKWSTYESPFPKVDKIIPASKLPENIKDIPDDILNWALTCETSSRPFRIMKKELEFLRKHNLPIPRRHPDERHLDRMKLRNPRKLYDRTCDKCGVDIQTTYSPEREVLIYCEECYNKEIY